MDHESSWPASLIDSRICWPLTSGQNEPVGQIWPQKPQKPTPLLGTHVAASGAVLREKTCWLAKYCLALLLLGGGSSCAGVQFFERRELSEPEMLLEQSPCAIHFKQKVIYSTEGAAGGVGTTGGGGCGCY